jgi:hypothetical protein
MIQSQASNIHAGASRLSLFLFFMLWAIPRDPIPTEHGIMRVSSWLFPFAGAMFLLFSISSAVNKLHDIYYRAEFWDEYKKKVEFELPGIAEEVQNQHPQRVNWSLKPSGTSGTVPDYFLPIWI